MNTQAQDIDVNEVTTGWYGQKFTNPPRNEKPLSNLQEAIPFDAAGNHLSFPDFIDCKYWKENCIWKDRLFIENILRGRSAAQFVLRSEITRTTYTMFMVDLCIMMQTTKVEGGFIDGLWTINRRGSNYGLKLNDAPVKTSLINDSEDKTELNQVDLSEIIGQKWTERLYIEDKQRGRSAAHFLLRSPETNKSYTIFMIDICTLMQNSIIENGYVENEWEVVRRGKNFGLKMVGTPSKPIKLPIKRK